MIKCINSNIEIYSGDNYDCNSLNNFIYPPKG